MNLHRLYNWLFPHSPSRRRPAGPRSQPRLEVLEDRLALTPFLVVGTTLKVVGTPGSDTFSFAPQGNDYLVKMNGSSFTAKPGQIKTIEVDGKGGLDFAYMTAGKGPNALDLSPFGGTLTGANYKVTLTSMDFISATGGAADTAT